MADTSLRFGSSERYHLRAKEELTAQSRELAKSQMPSSPNWLKVQRMIFANMENWLDQAETNLWLTQDGVPEMIVDAIRTREERGHWKMFEFVIMGNHIHLFCEFGPKGMKWVMEDFKRWTGHQAAKLILIEDRFWQREWFDHWSRSDNEDDRIVAYIRNNPVKAKLVNRWQDWPWVGSN